MARRLGFASLPLAVLAILIGSQTVSLFVAMHVDDTSPWIRNFSDMTTNEWINLAKWVALGLLFWFWYALFLLHGQIRSLILSTVRW